MKKNIQISSKNEINYLKKQFAFEEKHLEASLSIVSAQRPMIYQGKDYLFIILHFPTLVNGKIVPGEIEFFIGHGTLISLHDGRNKALNDFFDYCKKDSALLESYFSE